MPYLARNNLLGPLLELAERHALKRQDVLRAAAISPSLAMQRGHFVESRKLIDAVEYAALESGRSDFGLLLGAQPERMMMGPIALLIDNCQSVAEAATEGARYIHLHNTALQYDLTRHSEGYTFSLGIRTRGTFEPRHYVEALISGCVGLCRSFLGPTWAPISVAFRHKSIATIETYKRAFGCPVAFEQNVNAIYASQKDFDRKMRRSEERTKLLIQRMIQELDAQQRANTTSMVTAFLRPLLASNKATVPHVAKLLRLTPRTLQRRLDAEGTTFQQLITQTRLEILNDYSDAEMTLQEMAPFLGLSDATAVSRFIKSNK